MRVFASDEIELLRRVSNGQGNNLYNLIAPWIRDTFVEVDNITNNVTFVFEATQGLKLERRIEQIQRIVILSVNLIKLFEDRGYIFTFINTTEPLPNPFTLGPMAVSPITYKFPDPRISKLFVEYSTREIFVTDELPKFIADGFITREEVRELTGNTK